MIGERSYSEMEHYFAKVFVNMAGPVTTSVMVILFVISEALEGSLLLFVLRVQISPAPRIRLGACLSISLNDSADMGKTIRSGLCIDPLRVKSKRLLASPSPAF